MFLFRILKHIGLIVKILSYINLIASLLANKTNNAPTKTVSKLFSKAVGMLALNFNVTNVSNIDGMPAENDVTKEIEEVIEK